MSIAQALVGMRATPDSRRQRAVAVARMAVSSVAIESRCAGRCKVVRCVGARYVAKRWCWSWGRRFDGSVPASVEAGGLGRGIAIVLIAASRFLRVAALADDRGDSAEVAEAWSKPLCKLKAV